MIAVLALLSVLLVVLGAYATVKVVGAAKRRVDTTISHARRTVEDHTLRAKSLAQQGPAGELAQLRLKLRSSLRATQEALQADAAEDGSLRESLALYERLSAHGHELDAELRRLESEPDRATLAERLAELRERTERIVHAADSLRWAARDRARRFAEDDLDSLGAQIDMETSALRHWQTAQSTTPTGTDGSDSKVSDAAAPPPPWPEAPTPESAGTAEQTWSDGPKTRRAEEPTQAAIEPPAPRPTYSWQKKPRPESTT
ncbi:secreted protein [Streptomyces zinciresistens K42]|uniref:Secreted protein n=1 Tax=Streptomyces zinciresistens K42 TaxID=700597 RepID=G2G7K3_9ACTN|nr:secreted protein [Streptomyces zinciresistens K42]